MKVLVVLLVISLFCIRCNSESDSDELIDPIEVDCVEINAAQEGGVYTVTMTNYKDWGIESVLEELNSSVVGFKSSNVLFQEAKGLWYTLNIPSDLQNTLVLTIKENMNVAVYRKLTIVMRKGNQTKEIQLSQGIQN